MFKKISSCALLACVVLAGTASPAHAQRQAPALGRAASRQTINILFGWFLPKGAGSRAEGDVLETNSTFLCTPPPGEDCAYDVGAFKGFIIGGEWLLPVGNYIEVGAGISYSSKTVQPVVYQEYTDSDGTEIESEANLRNIPLSFTVRVLPLGQMSRVQPYVGGGLGVFLWHYSEVGEFIDFAPATPLVFEDIFEASGTSIGPIILGGLRYATERFSVGGEVRYHWATGDVDPLQFPPATKMDLGGWTIQGTLGFRF